MPTNHPILIVEDDEHLRQILTEQLAADHGFVISSAATLEAADRAIKQEGARFDAVLLDVSLPDGDGRDYCARLRHQGYQMPVIMLTGVNGEDDVVRGLDSGANDYITKPFRLGELLARLRTQLRLFEGSEEAAFSIGPYTFWPAKKYLQDTSKNRRIRLTGKEVALLRYFCRMDGRVADRQTILKEVWGDIPDVSTHTLETHIYRLRQKMEANSMSPALLVTDKAGYHLNTVSAPAESFAETTV